jgi:hypothetical protein
MLNGSRKESTILLAWTTILYWVADPSREVACHDLNIGKSWESGVVPSERDRAHISPLTSEDSSQSRHRKYRATYLLQSNAGYGIIISSMRNGVRVDMPEGGIGLSSTAYEEVDDWPIIRVDVYSLCRLQRPNVMSQLMATCVLSCDFLNGPYL